MELQALLVLCGVGVSGVAILLLMGLFSASGTSYEEAMAQQRRATNELLALADNKSKSKKISKKANKKQAKKEKNKDNVITTTGSEVDSEAQAESGLEDDTVPTKPHVEFSPAVVVEVSVDEPLNVKVSEKKEEVIEKKEGKPPKQAKNAKPAQKQNVVEAPKEEGQNEQRYVGEAPLEQRKVKKVERKNAEAPAATEEAVQPLNPPQPTEVTTEKLLKQALAPSTPSPPATKSKKKKPEQNMLSFMAGDSSGVAAAELVRVIRGAALSRSEVQLLTDALLDKHHDPLPQHSDWSEGPNDPMQKLKKQLAEKEKALADEIEASQALHAKLKELRTNLNSERARATAASRAGEQAAAGARAELVALQARLTRLFEDNRVLAQDKLVLQAKLNEESEAQAQRAQMEMHIQRLSESEAALAAQMGPLQAEAAAAQQLAADLTQQLQEANRAYAELENQRQCAIHAEQLAQQELRTAQGHLTEVQNEVQRLSTQAQTAESSAGKLNEDLEKQNGELKTEISSLREKLSASNTELAELNQLNAISQTRARSAEKVIEGFEKVCQELKTELSSLQEKFSAASTELAELKQSHSISQNKLHSAEKLKEDIEKQNQELAKELTSLKEQLSAANTTLAELKQLSSISQNGVLLSNREEQKAAELVRVEGAVEALRGELAAAQRAGAEQRLQLAQLREQLQRHQDKNDELRTKNWKIMEALQTTEKALQTRTASALPAQDTLAESIIKAKESQISEVANVLRSACPTVAPTSPPSQEWLQSFAENLKKELEKREGEKKQIETDLSNKILEKENQRKQLESDLKKSIEEKDLSRKQMESEMQKQLLEKENARKKLESELQNQLQQVEVQKKLLQSETVPKQVKDARSSTVVDSRVKDLEGQNERLQALVDKYKIIIDDTEGVLSRLQQDVSVEETRWAQQLADKQRELDQLRQRTVLQLQQKIDSLQAELKQAQSRNQSNSFADLERFSEEKLMSGFAEKHSAGINNVPLSVDLDEK